MKTLNLTMAIIYTVIYVYMLLTGMADGDTEMVVGCILLSGPVVANWITYSNLKNN